MFIYGQFWKSLAQKAEKLNQRLIIIIYTTGIQLLTHCKKQTKLISLPVACLSFSKKTFALHLKTFR